VQIDKVDDANGLITYKWDFGNAFKQADRFSKKEVPVPRLFPEGKHEIKLTVIFADPDSPKFEAEESSSQYLTVGQLGLAINNNKPWIGEKIQFENKTKIPAAVKKGTTFTWNFGDGSKPVKGEKVGHPYVKPGKYEVVLTIQRPNLKKPLVVKGTVDVLGVIPKINVAAKNLNVFIGQPIPFKVVNESPGAEGAFPPKTEFKWDFGDNSPKSPENTKREPLF